LKGKGIKELPSPVKWGGGGGKKKGSFDCIGGGGGKKNGLIPQIIRKKEKKRKKGEQSCVSDQSLEGRERKGERGGVSLFVWKGGEPRRSPRESSTLRWGGEGRTSLLKKKRNEKKTMGGIVEHCPLCRGERASL